MDGTRGYKFMDVLFARTSNRAESLVPEVRTWKRLLPIVLFMLYLSATVFLFAFGPWPWPVNNAGKLYTFLGLAHLALLVGYLSAAFKSSPGYFGPWKPERLLWVSVALNLLLFVPTSYTRTGRLLPDVLLGMTNPGAAYAKSFDWRLGVSPVAEYLRMLTGPLLSLLIPLTMFYWPRLTKTVRALAVASIVGFIALYIATGTNKGLADIWVIGVWVALAAYLSGRLEFTWKHVPVWVLLNLLYMTLFLSFFIAGQLGRPGSGAVTGNFGLAEKSPIPPAASKPPVAVAPAPPPEPAPVAPPAPAPAPAPTKSTKLVLSGDQSNFLVKDLPPKLRTGAMSLSSYLTQGYYALSLSLEKPFVPMYGVGNSMFLYRNAAKLTGNPEIEKMPYPVRIEEDGWNAYTAWSSIYPWIASDVSFPGTLLVIFLIGRLTAMAWIDTLEGSNPFALVMFTNFLIMLLYFPGNNQLLQTGEGVFSFYGVLALWLLTRQNYGLLTRFNGDLGEV